MGPWALWSILTVSSSELMVVIFSCVLFYLAVDYVCTLRVFPHTKIPVEIRGSPYLKRRSAPVALILVASDRLCCLATTGTNDHQNHPTSTRHQTWRQPGRGFLSLSPSATRSVLHPFPPLAAAGSAVIPYLPSIFCILKCQLVLLHTNSAFLRPLIFYLLLSFKSIKCRAFCVFLWCQFFVVSL